VLTLAKILKATPRDVITRANTQCSVRIVKSIYDIDANGEHKFVLGNVKATDGNRVAAIKFYQLNKKNLVNSEVWVYCSCPYHKYYCEVALAHYGSTSIIESNGKYPFVNNSRLVPFTCKHIAALARKAPTVRAVKAKTSRITSQEIELMLKQIGPLIKGL